MAPDTRNAAWELGTVYEISAGQSDQYDALREAAERTLAERDAARAEVAALRKQLEAISDEAADLRTELDLALRLG